MNANIETLRELKAALSYLTEEQLDCNITVERQSSDECYPAIFEFAGVNHDVLDLGHPLFYIADIGE